MRTIEQGSLHFDLKPSETKAPTRKGQRFMISCGTIPPDDPIISLQQVQPRQRERERR